MPSRSSRIFGSDEEEAEVLVPAPVHGHADAVHQRGEDDDHLGVLVRHPVVTHRGRLDPVLRELAQQLQRDVDDDLDVHPRVVVDLHPHDRVDVRDMPPRLQLRVGVGAVEHAAKLPVAALGQADAHARDGFGRAEPGLADGLGRHGPVDALLDLGIERLTSVRCAVDLGHAGRIVAHASRAGRAAVGLLQPRDLAPCVRERLAKPASVDGVVQPAARAGWMRERDRDRLVDEVALADAVGERPGAEKARAARPPTVITSVGRSRRSSSVAP